MKTYKLAYIKKNKPTFAKNDEIWNHIIGTHVFANKNAITLQDLKNLARHYKNAEAKYVRDFIFQVQVDTANKPARGITVKTTKQVQKQDEARARAHLSNTENRYKDLLNQRRAAKAKGHNNKAKVLTERIIKAKNKVQEHEIKYAKVKQAYVEFMKSELKRLA